MLSSAPTTTRFTTPPSTTKATSAVTSETAHPAGYLSSPQAAHLLRGERQLAQADLVPVLRPQHLGAFGAQQPHKALQQLQVAGGGHVVAPAGLGRMESCAWREELDEGQVLICYGRILGKA